MQSLSDATAEALHLLVTLDSALWSIIATSFSVSLTAILLAAPAAVCVGFLLAFLDFPGRRLLLSTINALVTLPAVLVGLVLYMLLSRVGPLGDLQLLFTSTAMVLGQMILCFPLLVAMCHSAVQAADRRAWETARTLGASQFGAALTLLREVRFALIAAVVAGFGRIIGEVGCSMMVGGNILHHTRNIPTAIAFETSRGAFAQGIALGLALLSIAVFLNFAIAFLQGRGQLSGQPG